MIAEPDTKSIFRSLFERSAMTFKMIWVLILIGLMLIPLSMIRSVMRERQGRRNEAVSGITSTWGDRQYVVGPMLVLPYKYKVKTWRDVTISGKVEKIEVEELASGSAYFLPSVLDVKGDIEPSRLRRGIYEAIVYKSSLQISGKFPAPNLAELDIADADVEWEKAIITMAISDLRGAGELLNIRLGAADLEFVPGCKIPGYASGIHARIIEMASLRGNLNFEMSMNLKGSSGIRFAPVGQQNRVSLASSWPAPSFQGAFLPSDRKISDNGFSALWEVSWYGRGYPQQSTNTALNADAISSSLYGVDFIVPVDHYRLVERSIKYGILFIALVFAVFFLFEVLSALGIHTIQYTLVGAALCLFYLALLSLSEFLPFPVAYGAGAMASAALIVLYCMRVLQSGRRTGIIAGALTVVFVYLYIVLQMQDYSLLFGTTALFIMLAIVMYATRNLDWSSKKPRIGPEA